MAVSSADSDQEHTSTLSTLETSPRRRNTERRWPGRLLRGTLILVILGGLAYGAYLLWPTVDERFVQPIADNTDDINALTDRLDGIEARIAELEVRTESIITTDDARISDETALLSRLDSVEAAIAAQTARLEGLEETAFGLAEADEVMAAETGTELTVLRAMELMSRARLSLYQANYGLARQDAVAAGEVLSELDSTDASVVEAISRLGVVADSLPDRPVAAAADLDIAWQALLGNVTLPVTGSTIAEPSSSTTSTTPTTTAP